MTRRWDSGRGTRCPLKPGRLFIVGDAKQSIYRFRGADLGVTRQVKEGGQLEALTLARNRRSQKPVLEWVNAAFRSLMGDGSDIQPEYVELEWHDDIQQDDITAGVRVFGGASEDRADDMRRQQARHVANMLLAYTSRTATRLNVYDKDARAVRPARVGDVCILICSRTGLGILERGLEDAGIPYRIEGGSLIFNTQEVQDLLNCLRGYRRPHRRGIGGGGAAFACLRLHRRGPARLARGRRKLELSRGGDAGRTISSPAGHVDAAGIP